MTSGVAAVPKLPALTQPGSLLPLHFRPSARVPEGARRLGANPHARTAWCKQPSSAGNCPGRSHRSRQPQGVAVDGVTAKHLRPLPDDVRDVITIAEYFGENLFRFAIGPGSRLSTLGNTEQRRMSPSCCPP